MAGSGRKLIKLIESGSCTGRLAVAAIFIESKPTAVPDESDELQLDANDESISTALQPTIVLISSIWRDIRLNGSRRSRSAAIHAITYTIPPIAGRCDAIKYPIDEHANELAAITSVSELGASPERRR